MLRLVHLLRCPWLQAEDVAATSADELLASDVRAPGFVGGGRLEELQLYLLREGDEEITGDGVDAGPADHRPPTRPQASRRAVRAVRTARRGLRRSLRSGHGVASARAVR